MHRELMWGNGHPHTYTNADLTTTVFKEARKGAPLQGMYVWWGLLIIHW